MADYRAGIIDEDEIDTLIAEDVSFEGDMTFDRPLVVKGRIKGRLTSKSDLHVNERAEMDARVEGETVWMKGRLTGDLIASKRLELFASSEVDGTIRAPDLIMQSGCRFNGRCEMPERSEPTASTKGLRGG